MFSRHERQELQGREWSAVLGCRVGAGQRQKKAWRERRVKKLVSQREMYRAVCSKSGGKTRKQCLAQMSQGSGTQLW